MDEEQYNAFVDALIAGDKTSFKEWEGTPYFDGCLPIEVMAERGRETLRHGPMKPMGLTNAHNPTVKAYAVVQLRQDNALGTLYNMVGFQTKLKYGAQARDLPHDPGPARTPNSPGSAACTATPIINSPVLLDATLQLKIAAGPALRRPDHRLRGLCRKRRDRACSPGASPPPSGSARRRRCRRRRPPSARCSATSPAAISSADDEPGKRSFQPMNINFGLFPPLDPGAVQKPEDQSASAARTRPWPRSAP